MTNEQYQKAVVVLLTEIKKDLKSGFERLDEELGAIMNELLSLPMDMKK